MIDAAILEEFRTESLGLCDELRLVVEKLEAGNHPEFPVALLKEFGLKIDRIMGMAKTCAQEDGENAPVRQLAALAELAKLIGYKAAERHQEDLLPVVALFLGDVVSAATALLDGLTDHARCERVTREFAPVLVKKLEWLKAKVLGDGAALERSKSDLDQLLARFSEE